MDYFKILGLNPTFDLDLKALEAAYFAAQREHHPDRFVGKPAEERAAAMQRSADINQAYEALKEPLSRAQYLLQQHGIYVGTDNDSVKPSAELLHESMEWREEISEAKPADFVRLDAALKKLVDQSLRSLSLAYGESMWQEMAEETLRLSYIVKAQEALAQRRSAAA